MNNDSDHLISLIFGSEIKIFTEKEKRYISNLFVDRNFKYCSKENVDRNESDLLILRYERPDLLLISDNNVFAIEHFKIDSSKTNRKGSRYKQKYNEKYFNDQQKQINDKLKNEKMVLHTEKIETKLQFDNLYINLINCFNDHYDNISEYNDNIRTINSLKSLNIEYIFFIEYDLIFPSFFMNDDNKMKPIYPHNDVEFIHFLKEKNELSGVMFYFDSGTESIPNVNQFIMIKENNLLEYKVNDTHVFDMQKLEIHDFEQPMMSSSSFIIPRDI